MREPPSTSLPVTPTPSDAPSTNRGNPHRLVLRLIALLSAGLLASGATYAAHSRCHPLWHIQQKDYGRWRTCLNALLDNPSDPPDPRFFPEDLYADDADFRIYCQRIIQRAEEYRPNRHDPYDVWVYEKDIQHGWPLPSNVACALVTVQCQQRYDDFFAAYNGEPTAIYWWGLVGNWSIYFVASLLTIRVGRRIVAEIYRPVRPMMLLGAAVCAGGATYYAHFHFSPILPFEQKTHVYGTMYLNELLDNPVRRNTDMGVPEHYARSTDFQLFCRRLIERAQVYRSDKNDPYELWTVECGMSGVQYGSPLATRVLYARVVVESMTPKGWTYNEFWANYEGEEEPVRYWDFIGNWFVYFVAALLLMELPCRIGSAAWRRFTRPPSGHCQTCGYNLTGNVSGICPECGSKA